MAGPAALAEAEEADQCRPSDLLSHRIRCRQEEEAGSNLLQQTYRLSHRQTLCLGPEHPGQEQGSGRRQVWVHREGREGSCRCLYLLVAERLERLEAAREVVVLRQEYILIDYG